MKKILIIISILISIFADKIEYRLEHNIKVKQPEYRFSKDTIIFLNQAFVHIRHDNRSKIVQIIPKDKYFDILDKKIVKGSPYPWYKIKEGWVTSPNVFITKAKVKTTPKPIKKLYIKPKIKQIKKKVVKKKEIIKKKIIKNPPKNQYNSFIGFSLGLSHMNVDKNNINGNINLLTKPDTNGYNGTIEAGIKNKDYFYALGYSYIKYNDALLENILISANKIFDYKLNPYIGVIGGVSMIKLTKSHINSTIPKSKGEQFVYGLQTGIQYPLIDKFSLHTSLQYLYLKHKTVLKVLPAQAELERKNHINLNIGIRYDFK